jgi:hypothetical protein
MQNIRSGNLGIVRADGREAGAYIYRRQSPYGEYYYELGETFWGTHDFVGPGLFAPSAIKGLWDGSIVAMVHTHPESEYLGRGSNFLSPQDMGWGNFWGINVYAVTPDVGIIKYDPITRTVTTLPH